MPEPTKPAETQKPAANEESGKPATPPAEGGAPAQGTEGKPVNEPQVDLRALHEAREQIKDLKIELDAMRATQSMYSPAAMGNPYGSYDPTTSAMQPQAPPQNNTATQLDELWRTDPRRAVQTELMMAMDWQDKVSTSIDNQLDELAREHPDAGQYRSDISRYIRTLPLNRRNVPGIAKTAYFYVKGQKVDDLINLSKEELIEKLRRGETVQGLTGSSSAPATPPAAAKPTQDQANAAAALGMSVEDYMANIKK